jgi:hypothetical protein
MYQDSMIGLARMGMRIVRNLMALGFRIDGHRSSGSPELAAAGSVRGRVPGVPALSWGEPT